MSTPEAVVTAAKGQRTGADLLRGAAALAGATGSGDDFDFSDLGETLATPDASIEMDDFSTVEQPHLLFESAVLFQKLRAFESVIKDDTEVVSKTVLIEPLGQHVRVTANTGDKFVQVLVPVLNTSKQITNTYVVAFKTLLSVLRNSGSKFLIMEDKNELKVRVLGGTVEFERFFTDAKLYTKPVFDTTTKWTAVDSDAAFVFASRALRTMALATRPEDRRIRCEDGLGVSNFLSSLVFQKIENLNVSFRGSDLKLLALILEGSKSAQFSVVGNEILIVTDSFKVAIPTIKTDDLVSVRGLYDKPAGTEFIIAPGHLQRILGVMKSVQGGAGVAKIYLKDGDMKIAGTTATGKLLEFPLATVDIKNAVNIHIPIAALLSTVVIMKTDSGIKMAVSEDGKLTVMTDTIKIILGSIVV